MNKEKFIDSFPLISAFCLILVVGITAISEQSPWILIGGLPLLFFIWFYTKKNPVRYHDKELPKDAE